MNRTKSDDFVEPLVVRRGAAMRMLSVGETKLDELIKNEVLDSFRDGGARKITVRSIHAYIERHIGRSKAESA
jgi:hypothetical protein